MLIGGKESTMSEMNKINSEELEGAVGGLVGANVDANACKIDGKVVKKELFDEYMRQIMKGLKPDLAELEEKYGVKFPAEKRPEK